MADESLLQSPAEADNHSTAALYDEGDQSPQMSSAEGASSDADKPVSSVWLDVQPREATSR